MAKKKITITGEIPEILKSTLSNLENADDIFNGSNAIKTWSSANKTQFGANLTSAKNAFANNTTLTSYTNDTAISSLDGSSMFKGATALTSYQGNITSLTGATYMFDGCCNLSSVGGISTLPSDISYMFRNCKSFDVSSFTGSPFASGPASVKKAVEAFKGTTISSINLSGWTSLEETTNMFEGCCKLTSIGTDFDLSLKSAGGMFINCSSLNELPPISISGEAGCMFQGCSSLTQVSVYVNGPCTTMFGYCTMLTNVGINLGSSASDTTDMFEGCSALRTIRYMSDAIDTTENMGLNQLDQITDFYAENITTSEQAQNIVTNVFDHGEATCTYTIHNSVVENTATLLIQAQHKGWNRTATKLIETEWSCANGWTLNQVSVYKNANEEYEIINPPSVPYILWNTNDTSKISVS